MSLNKAILIGNLGNDPEMRVTPNDTKVCNFSLATSEKYNGESKTEWHRCVAFNKQAEVICQYLKKGSKVYLEGKIQTSSYEQDGVKKYSTEIIVREFQFLDSKPDSQTGNSAPTQQRQSQPQQAQPDFSDMDSVPF